MAANDIVARYVLKFHDLASKGMLGAANSAKGLKSELASLATQAGIGLGIGAAVKAAADFEKAMFGVAKQVQGARGPGGELTKIYYDMEKGVVRLSRVLPIPTNQIAEMWAAGARMGVANKDLETFTMTAGKMATAFDLPAEQAVEFAERMGKISNIMGLPITKMGDLGDVINYLDDNAISKGPEIIDVLQRIGGTAKTIGLAADQTAALASTFLSLGSAPEVAATAANALMRELAIAEKQPKRFQQGLKEIGLAAKTVQDGMSADPRQMINRVLELVSKLPKREQLGVLTDIFGKEYADDIAKIVNNLDELRRQQELATKGQGSLTKEFNAGKGLTFNQFAIFKNQLTELAISIGQILLPPLNQLMGIIGPIFSKLAEWAKENPQLTSAILGMVGGGWMANKALGMFGGTWGGVISKIVSSGFAGKLVNGIMKIGPWITRIGGWIKSIGPWFLRLGTWIMKIGPWIARVLPYVGRFALSFLRFAGPIGLAITAGVLLYQNWDKIKAGAQALWEGIKSAWGSIKSVVIDTVNAVIPYINKLIEAWNFVLPDSMRIPTLEAIPNVSAAAAQGVAGRNGGPQRVSGEAVVTLRNQDGSKAGTAYVPFQPVGSNRPRPNYAGAFGR